MVDVGKVMTELQMIAAFIGLIAGLLIAAVGGLVIYMRYFDAEPPFVSTNVRILDAAGAERYTFRPGDIIELRRDFCVSRDTPVQVGRMLRAVGSNTGISIDSTNQVYRRGCGDGGNLIQIPPYTPPGRYRYIVSVRYSNNILRDDVVELPPVFLEVVR